MFTCLHFHNWDSVFWLSSLSIKLSLLKKCCNATPPLLPTLFSPFRKKAITLVACCCVYESIMIIIITIAIIRMPAFLACSMWLKWWWGMPMWWAYNVTTAMHNMHACLLCCDDKEWWDKSWCLFLRDRYTYIIRCDDIHIKWEGEGLQNTCHLPLFSRCLLSWLEKTFDRNALWKLWNDMICKNGVINRWTILWELFSLDKLF